MLKKMAQMCEQFWHKYAKSIRKVSNSVGYSPYGVSGKHSTFGVLDKQEKDVLLPLIIKMLNHRDGKEKVYSNTKIRAAFLEFGEEVTDLQIRKLVFHIRTNGLIELLIANSDGYYIAEHSQDIAAWVDRQSSKIESMKLTMNAIKGQHESNKAKLKSGKSKLYPQLLLEL